LSIKVRLLLQSNSEEIKQISFVQHYKKKSHEEQGDDKAICEAIADYVRREYHKEMRLLVKNQKENEAKKPVMPDMEEAKSPFVMKKYETELKQYHFKKERYEEHNAKIFVIVKGQCTLNMKNKVESLKSYDLIEANDDVIKLLNGLKELTFKHTKCNMDTGQYARQ
jgi:hypothetical protein